VLIIFGAAKLSLFANTMTDIDESSKQTQEERFWAQVHQEAARKSIDFANEGARNQIGVANTIASGIYAAIISSGNIKEILAVGGWEKWLIIILIIMPMLCWFVSILFAYAVFMPEKYRLHAISPPDVGKLFDEMINYKTSLYYNSQISAIIGLMFLIINVFVYLVFMPTPSLRGT
jgi:hypothetical protein